MGMRPLQLFPIREKHRSFVHVGTRLRFTDIAEQKRLSEEVSPPGGDAYTVSKCMQTMSPGHVHGRKPNPRVWTGSVLVRSLT